VRNPNAIGRDTRQGTRETPRYAVVARASAAGILFPVSIVAGYLLGKWLGKALGLGEVPAFVGAALGAAAGFWNLYRLLRGLESGGEQP
jgi:positive regulator of sigma E activity